MVEDSHDRKSDVQSTASIGRRRLLQVGAIGVPAILTLRGGPASAATSSMCMVTLDPKDENYGLTRQDRQHDAYKNHGYYQTGYGHPRALAPKDIQSTEVADGSYQSYLSGDNGAYWRYYQDVQKQENNLPGYSCLASIYIFQNKDGHG